jgi:hypothetical protein
MRGSWQVILLARIQNFANGKVELLAGLFRSAEPTTEEQQFRHYAEELGLPSQLSRDRTIPLFKESPGRGRALLWWGS